jgi:hypothetical protein
MASDLSGIIGKNQTNSIASLRGVMSSPIEGRDKLQFLAAVHLPPVTSPVEAVRAAIVAEHRKREAINDLHYNALDVRL